MTDLQRNWRRFRWSGALLRPAREAQRCASLMLQSLQRTAFGIPQHIHGTAAKRINIRAYTVASMRFRFALLVFGLALPGIGASAEPQSFHWIQSTFSVPVSVSGWFGVPVHQNMEVTIVRPADNSPHPFLILLHGRPIRRHERARMGRVEFPVNAEYFARLGFVVLTPTRIGYGVTGGPDVEETGPCYFKDYSRGMVPVVDETRDLLQAIRVLPFVDPNRGLVVGDSFGGIAAIAIAAAHLPGVVGAVNFSGGDGGDSVHRFDRPCRPDQMEQALITYGRNCDIPTLWMYSENDYFWGPIWPGIWFQAFHSAGGLGRFVKLPPDKNNGHFIFNRNPMDWHPAFDAFVSSLHLPA